MPAKLDAPKKLLKVDGSEVPRGQPAEVVFQLSNEGNLDVQIKEVSSSCSCLVPSQMKGRTIRAGEQMPFKVLVSIPQAGTQTRTLMVFHNGRGSPLVLQVQVSGAVRVPFVAKVVNPVTFFDDLSQMRGEQSIVVKTVENLGEPPWLNA
ncbi:MAG: DUF1573 domain-containing protein [Planctomycetes bacterium]|nr:DUF1573 domain-containing protein [Planctomycetota bacterium]